MNKIKEDPENEEIPAQPLKVIKKVSPTKKTPPGLKKLVKFFFMSSRNQPFSLFHHFLRKILLFQTKRELKSLKFHVVLNTMFFDLNRKFPIHSRLSVFRLYF